MEGRKKKEKVVGRSDISRRLTLAEGDITFKIEALEVKLNAAREKKIGIQKYC
jgi:hypothetical protein